MTLSLLAKMSWALLGGVRLKREPAELTMAIHHCKPGALTSLDQSSFLGPAIWEN